MPLLTLAKADPATVAALSVQQLVANAGDGDLRDKSLCSQEFREYLRDAEPERLADYARQCLSQSLPKGGQILQDVVNELGRRLGYDVENGRYSGIVGGIGYDGLWTCASNPALIVEVKTTDAYRLSLDTLAGYHRKLVEKGVCTPEASILIVVGRQDTGELEAQIRGSRHAWSVRLISVESLVQLVAVRLDLGSPSIDARIRNLLRPAEYTRLDALVDLVFSAAKEEEQVAHLSEESSAADETENQNSASTFQFTPAADLHAKRMEIIAALNSAYGCDLLKQTRASYACADGAVRAIVSLSKRYEKPAGRPYWYAYHPHWDEFLGEGDTGLFVLGMMDRERAFAIPVPVIRSVLDKLNTSNPPDGRMYWHIHLLEDGDDLSLYLPGAPNLPLKPYAV